MCVCVVHVCVRCVCVRVCPMIPTPHSFLFSECFGVSPEEHDQLLERAKQEVLQQMTNFKAVIKVRVISAEKLATCEG